MQISTCKKSTRLLKPFQSYWRFVISENLLFGVCYLSFEICYFRLLHATNKQNNSTLPRDIGILLFWRTIRMPGHARPNPTNIT